MSPLVTGVLIGVVTVVVLLSGVPVAVGLGVVAISFLLIFEGPSSLTLMAELFFGKLDDFTLLAIPMFIVMGAAIAASQAGADLYDALDRWLSKIPGGLVISNLGGCALFSALSGSSPATCAAIGKMGIPAMRERGFSDSLAAGAIAAGGTLGILIPPSITMIVYGIATETSIGRLFLAGVVPGLMLTTLFMMWALFATWRFGSAAVRERNVSYSWKERFQALPKVLPFLTIILAVVCVLYGGVATPSETAGVGAFLVIVLVMVIYRVWQPSALWKIMKDSTRESVMILFIIAASGLFSFMLSSLYAPHHHRGGLRPLLVRRGPHREHGDRPHHAARGIEPLRDQQHRAGHRTVSSAKRSAPLHAVHGARHHPALHLPATSHMAPKRADGRKPTLKAQPRGDVGSDADPLIGFGDGAAQASVRFSGSHRFDLGFRTEPFSDRRSNHRRHTRRDPTRRNDMCAGRTGLCRSRESV